MRLQSLFALAAAGALLLPFSANAGTFPKDKEGPYMDQCIGAATAKGISAKDAHAHCTCGKNAIEKELTDNEIKSLDGTKADNALISRVQNAVKAACAPKS